MHLFVPDFISHT